MIHIVQIIANNSSVPYFKWFAEFSNGESKIKFSFIALHHEYPKMIDEMKERGCDCYWIPFNHETRKTSWLKSFFRLSFLFLKLKPDIVHSHLFDDSLVTIIASMACRIKRRFVTKSDTTFHWNYAPKAIFLDRFINNHASHIIAISNESMNFIIEKEGADVSKIHLIHHGINIKERLQLISSDKKELLINKFNLKGKYIIGTVSRLIDWKGYKTIIEGAQNVIETNPNALFVFVGTGPQKAELEELVRKKSLQNHVVFTGWIEPELTPAMFSLFDIYLHTAYYEPFGFVIAEALAHGLPTISTPTGAALDSITHKKNGFLIEYNNSSQIAEAIRWIQNSNTDKHLNLESKKTAEHLFDFSLMYKKYIDLYKESMNVNF